MINDYNRPFIRLSHGEKAWQHAPSPFTATVSTIFSASGFLFGSTA